VLTRTQARAGNIHTARRVFKFLLKHMPWNGPVYQEACHLEEKYEEYGRAIEIVEKVRRCAPLRAIPFA
jgi:hypothetical protein